MLDSITPLALVPEIPVGDWIETGLDWLKDTFEPFFDGVSDGLDAAVEGVANALLAPDPIIVAALLGLLAWLVRDWKLGLGSFIGMIAIQALPGSSGFDSMWEPAMWTLAQVVLATIVCLVIGVPIGIWAGRTTAGSRIVRPVMDFLQTMPAMVWLIPAIALFGIGNPPAMVAIIIFAIAPSVRMTELGIRQVDSEVVEAGQAFGSSPRAILKDIQLPLAMPTVMAGVNQVIMLALSMTVIAGMVGADGLGQEVTAALGSADLPQGFDAGFAVVVLAIFLDRLTASVGSRRPGHGRIKELRDRFTRKGKPAEEVAQAA